MNDLEFTWNREKADLNFKKHGVSFNDAITVFHDEYAKIIPDPDHSTEEERFVIIGISFQAHLLVVCHCYRDSENVIRIISARKATKQESKSYQR
jgi:uncharacterized DUF497 family protein